jgi:arylsulfatase A-like enzyme
MKAIMVMFDSLNRRMLPPYGCDWVNAPNFKRLAQKTVTFDNCYIGSMPCMPARRELHTGRYNFLHRSWGPMEPFDDSMPEILKNNGVYTHLVSDHYHYWEDGGCTYHTRYSSWEISRGQEGDPWKGRVGKIKYPESLNNKLGSKDMVRQDWVNRDHMKDEDLQPQAKTFNMGLEFIKENAHEDNWFLHIETFDPHEPFFTQKKYKDMYPHQYNHPHFDWPPYMEVREPFNDIEHVRYEYAALVSMCDKYLGKVLDMMDEFDLWKDTMLIVNTDHGYLLGEHGCWAKCWAPFYNEVAHTPLFIWNPETNIKGVHRNSLVQTIDLAPTLLDFFGVEIPEDMQGKPLMNTITDDTPVRQAGLFGIFGGQVNVTDGRYIYMRSPSAQDNKPLYQYTLMPTRHGWGRAFIDLDEIRTVKLAQPFSFTKGCKTMKLESVSKYQFKFPTALYDLVHDPLQKDPVEDEKIENMMKNHLIRLLKDNDAPEEQFKRLGLIL